MSEPKVQGPSEQNYSNKIDIQKKGDLKGRRILIKPLAGGSFKVKGVESPSDQSVSKFFSKVLGQSKPTYADVAEVNTILKNHSNQTSKESAKVIDVALHVVLASLYERQGKESGTGHAIGLKDLHVYSDDLHQKLLEKSGQNPYVEELLTAAKLLQEIKTGLIKPDFENKSLKNISISTLKELSRELEELKKTSPSPELDKMINTLNDKIVYEEFKAKIQAHEPGSAEFKKVFKEMSPDDIKKYFPRFLKEVFIEKKQYKGDEGIYSDKEKKTIERNEKDFNLYKGCITELIVKFPEMEKYIGNLVFSRESIDLLINKLKTNENSPFQKVSYQSFELGGKEFKEALKKIDLSKNQQLEWVISYAQDPSGKYKYHMAPLHIRVQDGHVDIIVTDSIGKETLITNLFQKEINKAFDELENGDKFSVFWVSASRQMDESNCPIFCLADMKEFITDPSLFDEIKRKSVDSEDHYGDFKFKICKELPVKLMRFHQSSTELRSQLNKLKNQLKEEKDAGNIKKLKEDIQILEQTIAKHVKRGKIKQGGTEEKDYNVFAVQRYRKYEALVVSELLKPVLSTL